MRIVRLASLTVGLAVAAYMISSWLRLHVRLDIVASGATIGSIDEFVLRLLPAHIEAANPGGLAIS